MPEPSNGRGLFRPWLDNGTGNALNLLAKAAEIKGGESILRTNVNGEFSGGSSEDVPTLHQLAIPQLMDIGNDPNFQLEDALMADSGDFHPDISIPNDLIMDNSTIGVENEMLEMENFCLNFEIPHVMFPELLDSEDYF